MPIPSVQERELVRRMEPYSYLIYKTKAGLVVAESGETGEIQFWDTDAKTVIQKALNALTPGRTWMERVVVKGNFVIDNTASPLTIPSYTIFELDGRLTALDNKKTMVYVNGTDIVLRGGIYDGNRGTEATDADEPIRVIQVEDSTDVIVKDLKVLNGFSRGIEVDNGFHVTLENIYAENCWRNVMVWSTSFSTVRSHVLKNIHTKHAAGGSGVDLGTVGYVMIDGIYSEEDNPVALSIDSCKSITVKNLISLFRGVALIFAGYNNTENVVIENAVSAGSGGGGVLAEIGADFSIIDLVLKGVKVLSPASDAVVLRRRAGTGVFDGVKIYDLYTAGVPNTAYSVVADSSVYNLDIADSRVDRPMSIAAPSYSIRDVLGYRTKNRGVATIPAGATSVTVAHGLASTPSKVVVTPRRNIGSVWVPVRDATSFMINCSVPTTAPTLVDWEAEI
jgi:hypothetical protein